MKWRIKKPALDAEVRWQWKFWVENYGVRNGWRGRLGYWLRWVASRIDGRATCIICMRTEPALDQDIRLRIIKDGFDRMSADLALAVKDEAVSQVVEEALPQGASNERAQP